MREVRYTIGDHPQVYMITVRKSLTIGELRDTIALAHKGRPVSTISLQGTDIDPDNSLEDWILRINDEPFSLRTVQMVQIIPGWRGNEVYMVARVS
jgi:hypothetical protein